MCPPQVIAGVQIVASAMSNMLAIKAQNQQADIQNQMRASNIANATKAQAEGQSQVNLNLTQEQAAVADKAAELRMEALQAKGTALASAENEGQSLESLLFDFDRQKARYNTTMQKNLENVFTQGAADKQGVSANAASQIDAIAPAAKASPVSAVIGTLGTALDAYHIYSKKPKSKDIGSAK